jgi:hypothetical protein
MKLPRRQRLAAISRCATGGHCRARSYYGAPSYYDQLVPFMQELEPAD